MSGLLFGGEGFVISLKSGQLQFFSELYRLTTAYLGSRVQASAHLDQPKTEARNNLLWSQPPQPD